MSSEKRANATVIIPNGINIDVCIELFDKTLIDGG